MTSKAVANKATSVITLDEKHAEMLTKFQEIEDVTIPKLLSDKKRLIKKLLTPDLKIEQKLDIEDKIKSISSKVKNLKGQKNKYLLENSKYIFQYFEDKKKINSGDNYQNTTALNSFFKIKTKDGEESLNQEKYTQSKKFYQSYWKNVNDKVVNVQDFVVSSATCEYCNLGELIPQDEDGILICNNPICARFVTYIVDSSKSSNKDPPNEVSYTAYIRLNHFKEILSQFQAKETTKIPPEVIEKIRNRIKKERITDLSTINYDKMREILRKLELNKYFEHIQYINSMLGIKPPIMNEELHETLCVLFIEIQKPWSVHCPPSRSNFFNYTYTLYQLCVLLDQTQYLPYIPMMKDREKQLEQDMIWKLVCNDLDWVFFPTV